MAQKSSLRPARKGEQTILFLLSPLSFPPSLFQRPLSLTRNPESDALHCRFFPQASAHAGGCAGVSLRVVITKIAPPTLQPSAPDLDSENSSDPDRIPRLTINTICNRVAEQVSFTTFKCMKVGAPRETFHEKAAASTDIRQRQPLGADMHES